MSSVKKSSSPETEVIVWAAYRILVWFAECHESHNLFDFFCLAFYVCTTYLGLRFFPIYIKIIIKITETIPSHIHFLQCVILRYPKLMYLWLATWERVISVFPNSETHSCHHILLMDALKMCKLAAG